MEDARALADRFPPQTMARRLFRPAVWLRRAAPGAPARPRSLEEGVDGPADQFYRMMDAGTETLLAQRPSVVAREVTGLWGGPVDGLFFDVTTLRLAREKADELRKKGYRQDGKPPRGPVVWALIQTRPGRPIG